MSTVLGYIDIQYVPKSQKQRLRHSLVCSIIEARHLLKFLWCSELLLLGSEKCLGVIF